MAYPCSGCSLTTVTIPGQVCAKCRKQGVSPQVVPPPTAQSGVVSNKYHPLKGPRASVDTLLSRTMKLLQTMENRLSVMMSDEDQNGKYNAAHARELVNLAQATAKITDSARRYQLEERQRAKKMTHEQKGELLATQMLRLPADERVRRLLEVALSLAPDLRKKLGHDVATMAKPLLAAVGERS